MLIAAILDTILDFAARNLFDILICNSINLNPNPSYSRICIPFVLQTFAPNPIILHELHKNALRNLA